MKRLSLLLFLGALFLTACKQETKTTENTDTTSAINSKQTTAREADYQDEYRDRANRMANRMATDMQFDSSTQGQVEDVYYNRSRRVAEIHNRYHFQSNNQSGGLAANADTTGMYGEIRTIDMETDNALRDILSPQQFQSYQTNRSAYYADDAGREIKMDGDQIKVNTGDMKIKAGPGESKVETSTYESKVEGQERKFKSKTTDTKIKSEPGKAKYESEHVKIKIKEKD